MMRRVTPNDFYEDDEPVEDVFAAFDRGAKDVTRPPGLGQTHHLALPGAWSPGLVITGRARAVEREQRSAVDSSA